MWGGKLRSAPEAIDPERFFVLHPARKLGRADAAKPHRLTAQVRLIGKCRFSGNLRPVHSACRSCRCRGSERPLRP